MFTLHEPGALLWHIFDDYVPPPVPEEAKQRRFLFIARNGVPYLHDSCIAPTQQLNFIPGRILQQKPRRGVRY